MRNGITKNRKHDPRIIYRGEDVSRLDNLTDAVFGIAITLLIFNLTNPNSFGDLLTFTKTLPAFLISISFILLIWNEHLRFAEIYTLNDTTLTVLNTLFISLVIFYVYPLRFMTLFLTNLFFNTNIEVKIEADQVPHLMIYYGFVVFALYFVLYLFYSRAGKIKNELQLNKFEVFYTKSQKDRIFIMLSVPIVSILLISIIKKYSVSWASLVGGLTYFLYNPLMIWWYMRYKRKSKKYSIV